MPNMLLVIASLTLTIFAWGVYGPTLHVGQEGMSLTDQYARLRPFVCVGLAYFLIGVLVPIFMLVTRGEKGNWTTRGTLMSLWAGVLGAFGALGIILALSFGGKPSYVMPLVFGGAPVVNSFVTIYWAKRMKEIGPVFLAGLVMVVLGAVTVLVFKPGAPPKEKAVAEADIEADQPIASESDPSDTAEDSNSAGPNMASVSGAGASFALQLLGVALTVCCWGSYGPTLHVGQAAMNQSRMRPMLCVGLSYFVIAVITPYLLLSGPVTEPSEFNFWGTTWSLAGGACGALGALGIIMSFNFGGRPVYVMPLVFSGAPVVNTFVTILTKSGFSNAPALQLAGFFAGLMLVIAGSAMVLVFAPKGPPPTKQPEPIEEKQPETKKSESTAEPGTEPTTGENG